MGRIIGGSASAAQSPLPPDWRAAMAVADSMQHARVRAARLLLDARAQARTIIASAHETAQQIAAAELRQAREQGYAEGLEQAHQELAHIIQPLAALIGQAAIDRDAMVRALDADLLALALSIASAVVKHEIAEVPETIVSVARAALREITATAHVALRVHPDDAPVLEPHLDMLGLPASVTVAIVPDERIGRGGCIVESGSGRVDATIEGQLDRIDTLLGEQLDVA